MNALTLLAGGLVFFGLAYRLYGSLLSRLFGVDPSRKTPAHEKFDGVDYVPAKNWFVLFGHHFSAICGAGPIIGPILAAAYWGWLPSLCWLLIGAVFMGAVSDFSSLFVSLRSGGQSIAEVAKEEVTPRARLLFSAFIWLSLILVIAVFTIFAARTFVAEPDIVVPGGALIPIALLTGWLMYWTRSPSWFATAVGLGLLGISLAAGNRFPVTLPSFGPWTPEVLWILILLAYCYTASILPVQILLQPRDYLASFILFAAIGLGIASVAVSRPQMQGAAFSAFLPPEWAGAGPLWPMLFVTIACGAISGFHALVSSGTTCKQIGSETHACRIGYGGMLTEGFVGILALIFVAAGLSGPQLRAHLSTGGGGPIVAYGEGFQVIAAPILGGYGKAFAILALNAFILTTLDAATRIARYLTTELLGIRSKHLSTAAVVVLSAWLALTGQWARIWPAFGTANQLIAGLALLVVSCWLLRRGKPVAFTLIPSFLMLATTLSAFAYQIYSSLNQRSPATGAWSPDFFIAGVSLVLILLASTVFFEALGILRNAKGAQAALERP